MQSEVTLHLQTVVCLLRTLGSVIDRISACHFASVVTESTLGIANTLDVLCRFPGRRMCIFVDVAKLQQRISLLGSQKCLDQNGTNSRANDTGDNVRHVSFYVLPM